MDETPDYTRYSLDDLLDVERHINQQRYPARYALVLQEIEKRRREPVPEPVAREPVPGGCLLKLVRFCGGGLLAASSLSLCRWAVRNQAIAFPFFVPIALTNQ